MQQNSPEFDIPPAQPQALAEQVLQHFPKLCKMAQGLGPLAELFIPELRTGDTGCNASMAPELANKGFGPRFQT